MGAKSVSKLADWQSKPIKVPSCVLFAHKSLSHKLEMFDSDNTWDCRILVSHVIAGF